MADTKGTLTVRVPGVPFPVAFEDWVHDRLFSTAEWANADTSALSVFGGDPGGNLPGGNRASTGVDTNIQRNGLNGLPPGWEALIYSIQTEIKAVGFSAGTPALNDQRTFAAGQQTHHFNDVLFCQFRYNNKSIAEGRMPKFPAGSGIYLNTVVTGQELATNGVPSPREQQALVIPAWLKPGIAFSFTMTPAVALTVNQPFVDDNGVARVASYAETQVTLEGLIKRPVT